MFLILKLNYYLARPVIMKPNLSTAKVSADATTKYKAICMRVRKLRIEKQLTQNEFAALINISRGNLNLIERGAHAPSLETIKLIKEKFRVSYDWILDGK